MARPRVFARQEGWLPGEAFGDESPEVEPRDAEGALRYANARALHQPAERARERAGVVAPVCARPDLVPVDDDAVAAASAQCARGEQREVRKRGSVHDVVGAPVAPEVPSDGEPEPER